MSENPRELIVKAFLMARQRGKPDWRRMQVGVLKNRLLQMTKNAFAEGDYGSKSFQEFLLTLPDVVQIDQTVTPSVAQLKDTPSDVDGVNQDSLPETMRVVRTDLWHAILDFTSGHQYGWDTSTNSARRLIPGEQLKLLPTISAQTLSDWRKQFLDKHIEQASPADKNRLNRWHSESLATYHLPNDLRRPWVQELVTRVEETLKSWFASEGISPPPIVTTRTRATNDYAAPDLEEMRTAAIRCIQVMTQEELQHLQFSPAVIARLRIQR